MTRPDSDAAPYEPVLEQTAQAWLVRLRGTPDAATRRAFEDWLAQRPAHAEAYARAEALWRLTEIPASRLAIEEADALEAYLRPRRASRNPRRWAYPLASVACLLAMLWLGGWWQPGDWLQDWRADYVAAPGQVAEWKLADGSYLSLAAVDTHAHRAAIRGRGPLGRQPVSGSFRSDDPEAALKSLQAVLGYRQQILFGRLVVIR
nr:DUF4880 domain-containing protein [Pseudomonas aeruginosa]